MCVFWSAGGDKGHLEDKQLYFFLRSKMEFARIVFTYSSVTKNRTYDLAIREAGRWYL